MTKIAVISDIHGNLFALESFLEDARKRAVDHVFCLGDSIAIGHESGKLLTVLKNIQNLTIVKGNHERAVLAAYYQLEPPKGHAKERKHHQWIADQLRSDEIEFLINMNNEEFVVIEGFKFYLVHYPMDDKFDYMDMESSEACVLDNTADYVLHGHDHTGSSYPFHFKNAKILNPGALGCSHDSHVCYSLIHIDNDDIQIEHVSLIYDRQKHLIEHSHSEIPLMKEIQKIFYGVQDVQQ